MRALAAIGSVGDSLAGRDDPQQVTLLELVQAVGEHAHNEAEVVATILHMLRTGRVKLKGCFRDVPIDCLTN